MVAGSRKIPAPIIFPVTRATEGQKPIFLVKLLEFIRLKTVPKLVKCTYFRITRTILNQFHRVLILSLLYSFFIFNYFCRLPKIEN